MKDFDYFGWRGCWRCQHCLAVCPAGAISIFNKNPDHSLLPPDYNIIGEEMQENVDPVILNHLLEAMQKRI